jgi:HlyD family secretion protein
MKKKLVISIAAILIIAAVIGYLFIWKRDSEASSATLYLTAPATKGTLISVITTTGPIQPRITSTVGSEVSGKIKRILVDFNGKVRAGQILAEIDPEPFQLKIDETERNMKVSVLAVAKTRIDIETAQKNYERTKSLFDEKVLSELEVEAADIQLRKAKNELASGEARVEQTQSQLDQLKVSLKNTIIVSPIDGIVVTRSVEPGQTVAASFTAPQLFTISDLNHMQIQCDVDETDMGDVKEGQEASFTVQAFPNEVFTGKIIQVRYAAATVQNIVTYKAILAIDNPELKFRPGMTANVTITTNTAPNALLVSNKAFLKPDLDAELQKLGPVSKAQPADFQQPTRPEAETRQAAAPQGSTSRARQPGAQPRVQKPKNVKTIWKLGNDGGVSSATLVIGISDNKNTEVKKILRGELKEGDVLITGKNAPVVSTTTQTGGTPRGGLRF